MAPGIYDSPYATMVLRALHASFRMRHLVDLLDMRAIAVDVEISSALFMILCAT